jgi:hypothetical protein
LLETRERFHSFSWYVVFGSRYGDGNKHLITILMNSQTRQYITDVLLTTKELSELIGVSEITLQKRYERDNRIAVLKGKTLLWDRRDFKQKTDKQPF